MRGIAWLGLGLSLVLRAAPARADVWDIQTDSDNNAATDNDLVPGSDQVHDLGALPGPVADEDWYDMGQAPYSSYEVVVDSTSGDIGPGFTADRISNDGVTVLQAAAGIGYGYSRSLSWANGTSPAQEFIRVSGALCGTFCGFDDIYHIRLLETTLSVPRFNNSGTQTTSLLLQNTGDTTVNGTVYFFGVAGGGSLASSAFILGPRALLNLNTSTVAPGVGGSLLIAHDGRYGALSGKAVALEPATGFTFDTQAVSKPIQ